MNLRKVCTVFGPWRPLPNNNCICDDLYLLTCIQNVLVYINTEGQCFIFNIVIVSRASPSYPRDVKGAGWLARLILSVTVTQHRCSLFLFALDCFYHNSYYCFFLSDPEGCNELCVGLTDRSVVLYRWAEEGRSLQTMKSFKLPGRRTGTNYITDIKNLTTSPVARGGSTGSKGHN